MSTRSGSDHGDDRFGATHRVSPAVSVDSLSSKGSVPDSALNKVVYRQSPGWGIAPRPPVGAPSASAKLAREHVPAVRKSQEAANSIFQIAAGAGRKVGKQSGSGKFVVVIFDDSPFEAESISMLC